MNKLSGKFSKTYINILTVKFGGQSEISDNLKQDLTF